MYEHLFFSLYFLQLPNVSFTSCLKHFFSTSRKNKKAVEGLVRFLTMKYAGIFQVAPSPSSHNSTLFRSTRSPKSPSPSIPLSFPPCANYPKDRQSPSPQISQTPVSHEQKWDRKHTHTHKHEPKIRTQRVAGLTRGLQVTCYLEKPLILWGRPLFFM